MFYTLSSSSQNIANPFLKAKQKNPTIHNWLFCYVKMEVLFLKEHFKHKII